MDLTPDQGHFSKEKANYVGKQASMSLLNNTTAFLLAGGPRWSCVSFPVSQMNMPRIVTLVDSSQRVRAQANAASALDVLAHAQGGRSVIQDFCPLAESLEWELGQEYLRQRGNNVFI